MYTLRFLPEADEAIKNLAAGKKSDPRRARKVRKALDLLAENPRHVGLRSHIFNDAEKKYSDGTEKLFTSYVENGTPGAWRILWRYGPNEEEIQILTIVWLGAHY